MTRFGRRAFRLALATGTLFLVGVAAVVALQAVGCDAGTLIAVERCSAAPAPGPGSTPEASVKPNQAMTPISIEIPENADCNGCHLRKDGTLGANPIPVIGHPVEGWKDCTACHETSRLVTTAPGHTGIHKDECLVCHTKSTPLPEARPHPPIRNTGCFECHGKTAPLPTDMSHRSDTNCWLCHRATPEVGGSSSTGG